MSLLAPDGRCVIVAIDHPLYAWPCPGLEDRERVIAAVAGAGADAVIASYGTVRDLRHAFGAARPIVKLDLTTVSVGGGYPATEHRVAYSLEDAVRVGAAAVLTFVQLGTPFELAALHAAAQVAAAADRAGIPYVCEIMPVRSDAHPDPLDPAAIAAAARTGAELGARLIKTTMPAEPAAVAGAVACGVPVVLAGGDLAADRPSLLDAVRRAVAAGAAGVAHGRNVWGTIDPAAAVAELREAVHG